MKKENLSVMDAIYRNADMGRSSIKNILKKVGNPHLRCELEKQLEYYEESLKSIEKDFEMKNDEPDKLNPIVKAWARIDLEMQTAIECDSSKIAELMTQGTNMGIIEIEKACNANENMPHDVSTHAKSVINHEKKYIEQLKPYL